jgi:hypothetical protein
MISVTTDLEIREAIINSLNTWRDPCTVGTTLPHTSDIVEQQDVIGWGNFFEGRIATTWEETQQQYYTMLQSRRTGK